MYSFSFSAPMHHGKTTTRLQSKPAPFGNTPFVAKCLSTIRRNSSSNSREEEGSTETTSAKKRRLALHELAIPTVKKSRMPEIRFLEEAGQAQQAPVPPVLTWKPSPDESEEAHKIEFDSITSSEVDGFMRFPDFDLQGFGECEPSVLTPQQQSQPKLTTRNSNNNKTGEKQHGRASSFKRVFREIEGKKVRFSEPIGEQEIDQFPSQREEEEERARLSKLRSIQCDFPDEDEDEDVFMFKVPVDPPKKRVSPARKGNTTNGKLQFVKDSVSRKKKKVVRGAPWEKKKKESTRPSSARNMKEQPPPKPRNPSTNARPSSSSSTTTTTVNKANISKKDGNNRLLPPTKSLTTDNQSQQQPQQQPRPQAALPASSTPPPQGALHQSRSKPQPQLTTTTADVSSTGAASQQQEEELELWEDDIII